MIQMKKIQKILALVIILSLSLIYITPAWPANSETGTLDIPINRKYFIGQINGEVLLQDPISYKKSLLPERYSNIQINGTVFNSTLLNPFSIWPPIAIIPGLRMLFLTSNSTVNLTIASLKGKFYLRNDNTTVRFYGMGILINITANLKI
jgi:hypothetical protein